MGSKRQNEANRRNARRSTGPKTATGKAKSSSNACSHGLSRPILFDKAHPDTLGILKAQDILSESKQFDPEALVRAKFELNRVRAVRCELLARLLKEPDPKLAERVRGLAQYERLAFAKQRRAIKATAADPFRLN